MINNCDNPSFTIKQKDDIQNLNSDVVKAKFETLATQIKTEFETKIKNEKIVTDKNTMKLLEDTTEKLAEKIKAEAKTTSYMALGPYLNLIFHLMENGDTDKEQLKNTITELDNLINNTPNSSPGTLIDGIFSPASGEPPAPPRPFKRQNAQLLNPIAPPVEETTIIPANPEETSKEETSKEETTIIPANPEETSKEETSKEETSKEETSKEETSKEETSKEETSIVPKETPEPQYVDGEKETTAQAATVTKLATPGCPSAAVDETKLDCNEKARKKAALKLHPDKNKKCEVEATKKFVAYNKMCDERTESEDNSAPKSEDNSAPKSEDNSAPKFGELEDKTPAELLQLENKPKDTPLPPIADALGPPGEIDVSVDEPGVPIDPMDTPGKTRNEAAVNRAKEAKRKLKVASEEAAKAAKETAAAATTEAAEAATAAAATTAATEAVENAAATKFKEGVARKKETAAAATTEAAEAATAAAAETATTAATEAVENAAATKFKEGVARKKETAAKLAAEEAAVPGIVATRVSELEGKLAPRKSREGAGEGDPTFGRKPKTSTPKVSPDEKSAAVKFAEKEDTRRNKAATKIAAAQKGKTVRKRKRKKGGGKKTQKGGKKVVKKVDKKKTKRSGKMAGKNKTKRRKN
jgi:hypothetical protein